MFSRKHRVLPCLFLCALAPASLMAQQKAADESKPDTPEITKHVEAAKKIAGTEWAAAANFFCLNPHPNKADDPLFEPTKIFDNVYAIGRVGTVVYAITTSDGVILIDSGYADQLDSVLLPGMQKVGLDPAKVKYILLGHGHGDHFGGAPYFQQKYGTKIVSSAADWDLMEKTAANAKAGDAEPPKRDVVAVEGQPITLGGTKVTPYSTPGHTPGSLAYIFQVKDGNKTYMAGLYGGTVLIPPQAWNLREYSSSLKHWADVAKKNKVEVELQNHQLYDNFTDKLAKLQQRKPGDTNPFVVGQASYQKFVNVIGECTEAQIIRLGK